jgi:hypothetical protein
MKIKSYVYSLEMPITLLWYDAESIENNAPNSYGIIACVLITTVTFYTELFHCNVNKDK